MLAARGFLWLRSLLLHGLLWLAVAPAWALDAAKLMEAAARLGPGGPAEAQALLMTIDKARPLDDEQRLVQINRYINRRIAFYSDQEAWGQADYWASPLESLIKGKGDCEDYAIAKYFSLVSAGVAESRLRMVYVRAMLGGRPEAHMVLAYYAQPEAVPLILDNLQGEVKPASQRPDLAPVFSFNAEGLWQGVGQRSAGDPLARLSLWRDLLAKVRAEGF
ncbi:transglutaminase-like cysteine peptidase [Pelomonas sp. SE-A7]|uniref:transglutaminase-like cysteine peptidase n=1 Tax=Pelomonas sp. SE-A7 TaxID=3054953 RepID=UPI00259CEEC0|nr:transglutaminase-like cysteine peptidase [Pelomonas sp. SE-A7]MDM4766097.1 transglutaminase-like cysteine peptidase [Pelomonas sp. SE-A7]